MRKLMEYKVGLITHEVETRMAIAELAANLMQATAPNDMTMERFMTIYRELSNEILEPLTKVDFGDYGSAE
jgi:hypothetical protein